MFPKNAFFNRYGILSIPLILLTFGSHFGFRPDQAGYKYRCWIYVLNFMFVCGHIALVISSCIVIALFNHFLSTIYYRGHTITLVNTGLPITAIVFVTIWIIYCFKRYNIFCLLEDIVDIRRNSLRKANNFFVICAFALAAGLFISLTYFIIRQVLLRNDFFYALSLSVKNDFLQHFLLTGAMYYTFSSWMIVLNVTLMITVCTMILEK